MSLRRFWGLLTGLVLAVMGPAKAIGQPYNTAEQIWQESTLPVSVSADGIDGPGADWLKARAARSQFVLFGEQHGVKGLPTFVSATYDDLYADGFQYLVLEAGPWFAQKLSERPVDDVLTDYPYSLAFDYDGEIEMLRTVQERYDEEGQVFWGIDQEITAIHPFSRLADIAPTWRTRRMAQGLYLKAALKGGSYLREDYSADIATLRDAMGEEASEEARQILDALAISQQIYVDWRAGNRGDQPMRISVEAREQYMMRLLDENLAEYGSEGKPVKAIVKMGGAHIIEGIGPNGIETLGNHAEKIARQNGMEALHIGIRAYTSDDLWLDEQFFDEADAVLIDAKQAQAYLPDQALAALPAEIRRDLAGFDALVYLRNAPVDIRSENAQREAVFRKTLLTRIGLVLIPGIILVSGLVMLLRFVFRTVAKGGIQSASRPVLPGLVMLATVALAASVFTIQMLAIIRPTAGEPAALTGGLFSSPMLMITGLGAALSVLLALLSWGKGWWGLFSRLHFSLLAAGLAGLAAYMIWWNIGGMLGS